MPVELAAPTRTGPYKYNVEDSLGVKPMTERAAITGEGVTYPQTSCEIPRESPADCANVVQVPKPNPATAIRGFAEPEDSHLLYVALQCSSAAFSYQEALDAATEVLERGRPTSIGIQLSADLQSHPNWNVLGSANPSCALALAQEAHVNASGRQPVVFMSVGAASLLLETHALHDEDAKLYTSLGSLVVVLPLFPFIAVTDSIPDLYLSEVQTYADAANTGVTSTNSIIAMVEQSFLLIQDPCLITAYDLDYCS